MRTGAALALLVALASASGGAADDTGASAGPAGPGYVGQPLGALSQLMHGVRGHVYAVDARTLYLKDLHYDGEGPAAYFYVGTSGEPGDATATRLRDERGAATPLRRYRNAAVTLALPDHLTLKDVRWFSIWCDDFSVNFGSISIPAGASYPRPARVGALRGVHGVSSDPIVVVDAQTLLVPNFSYDGEAPDAKFWVGRGDKPSPQGIRIPDENGKEAPLGRYDRKTIVLTLPGELTVFDIGHVGVWCEAFTVDFGHVTLPRARVANVPPSLKMLGVSPQSFGPAAAAAAAVAATDAPAARTRGRGRPSNQRLEATTYRPRLGAGPLPALLAGTSAASALRRREYSPQQEQTEQQLQSQLQQSQYQEPREQYQAGQPKEEYSQTRPEIQNLQPQQQTRPEQSQPAPHLVEQLSPDYQVQPQQLLYYKQTQPLEYQQQQRTDDIQQLLAQARALEQQRREYQQLLLNIQGSQQLTPLQNPIHQQLAPLPSNGQIQSTFQLPSRTQDNLGRLQQLAVQGQGQGLPGHQGALLQGQVQDQIQGQFQGQIQGPGVQYRLVPYKYTAQSFSKLNCEVLLDDLAFEVRWAVAGDSIVIQLVAKLEDGEYMSFGLSGSDSHSQMVGGDVAVAWVEQRTLKGHAVDYYLDAKSQCAGVRGSCPDERLGAKTNSLRLLNAALVNGYSIVTYQRAVKASDQLDRTISTNGSQPILWAVGPLNDKQEVSYHTYFLKGDKFIEFGRPPVWNCPMPEMEEERQGSTAAPATLRPLAEVAVPKPSPIVSRPVPPPQKVAPVEPWDIPAIQCDEPADGVFYAQMGPTGGKHGYPAITGHVGWGIAWYINGLLVPEVVLVRGRRYTFVVEGGADPAVPARYHPFYITNDPIGGYFHKSDEEKKGVEIYAGVRRARDGSLQPTGAGRLCVWTADGATHADEYHSFGAYQRALTLVCDEGSPGLVTWTPDRNTPDTVYYQCFTHRHLGWKIRVVDECPAGEGGEGGEGAASVAHETVVPAPGAAAGAEGAEGTQVPAPHPNRLDHRVKHQKIINTHLDYTANAFSNGNRASDEPPVSGDQLAAVIEAAEELESRGREEFAQGRPPAAGSRGPTAPERPPGDGDEYAAPPGRPSPPGRPLTLQSVMRPGGPPRPYRRPSPPELRRRPPHPAHHRGPPPHMMMNGPLRHGPPNPSNGQGHGPNGSNGPPQGQHSSPNGQNGSKGSNGGPQYPPSNGQHGQTGSTSDQQESASHYGPASAVLPGPITLSHGQSSNYGPSNGPHNNSPSQNGQSNKYGPTSGQHGPFNGQHGSSNGQHDPSNGQHGPSNGSHGPPNGQHGPNSGQNGPPGHPGQSSNQHGPQPGKKYNKPPPPRVPRPPVKPQHSSKPPQKSSGHMQTIIMGKPAMPSQSQTLSLGKTDIIANQVVKSQITLPGFNEPIAQHSMPQNFYIKPGAGQIILGKPVEHPSPLDQQMAPSVSHPVRPLSPPMGPVHPPIAIRVEIDEDNLKSSDFMGESVSSEVSTSSPALNTGFKPDSIVIESGFKPIIREPLMAGEDRIADFDNNNSNRREDTDVIEDYEESPQYITNQHIFPSEKLTESFEPMFIPSPEDNMSPSIDILLPTEDRTKEVFPSNHAKEDRPHPVYVKPETETKENFKDTEVPDMLIQSSRVSPQYLPPDNKAKQSQKIISDEFLTSYDGKLISATSLTSIPVSQKTSTKLYSAKRPTNAELLLNTPQFGKFRGEMPPSIAELESQGAPLPVAIDLDYRNTRLKLVNALREPDSEETDDLKAEASEVNEVTEKEKETEKPEEEDEEEYEEEEEDEDNDTKRRKRETKGTQFQAGPASETLAPSSENKIKNQVDFEQSSGSKGSAMSNYFSFFIGALVMMCHRFL